MGTDAEWEKWGRKDPYFGVITDDKFRSHEITEEAKEEFFKTGRIHINHVMEVCRQHIDPSFSPKRALDFGCGTGRLVIPLAEIAGHVVGLDVSESMLKEAFKNCDKHPVMNVSLLKSDDNLSCLDGCFDFIHSFIVFQHISVDRGRRIFRNLLDHLEDGGICAVQFTYSKVNFAKSHGMPPQELTVVKMLKKLKRLVRRLLKWMDPEMQMNPYNANEIFFLIQSLGIRNFYTEFTDHGGELGIFLYFQKPKSA